ncbi:MAG: carbohydrate binding family 9 domain-containing protein [Tannerellaceae bacterium]|nr:carbohydrate binding family 9 domain-containing protein [Tannerellaceae bacterium]
MKKQALLFLFVSSYVLSFAQQDSVVPFDRAYKRVYRTAKVAGAMRPVIDGRLDDELWQTQGEWSEAFVQVMPNERFPTSSPTWMKVLYDDRYIYVGVYCRESEPEKIIRFTGNRDDNSLGDLISVAFDTYHDYRAAPEFNINAGGNKTDLIVTDQLAVNRSWNAVWEGRTQVNRADSSWTAELSIPFSQLRYNRLSDEGVWGLHVRRVIRYKNETQNWSLIPLKNNGHVFSFGEMRGMERLPKPRNIEFLPYAMGKKGSGWGGSTGIDAKFALSDFTLDVTVNPDFGQVELDPSVMNLTAFETFYDEMRPFFLEGKHILDFSSGGDRMFYTRRIGQENVPIIGALKLTGTNRKGVTAGVVQSVTARRGAEEQAAKPLTNYTVARVQKNWKGNILLGGMITSVNRASNEPSLEETMIRHAFTAAVDYTHYFSNRLYYVDAKGMFSSLNGSRQAIALMQNNPVHYYQRASAAGYLGVDESRTSLNGTGGYVKAGRKGNARWSFSEEFNWTSPGFDLNDVGYLKQADARSAITTVEFKQTEVWRMFRSNTFAFSQENKWDYGGSAVNNAAGFNWKTMFINRFELSLSEAYGWNRLDTRLLRGGPDMRYNPYFLSAATFNTDKARRMMFMLSYTGDHNTDGYNRANTLSPSLSFRMGNHVYLSGQFTYSWNTDNLQYVAPRVMGHMKQETWGLTLKLQANVTPDVSLQFYGSPFTSAATFSRFKEAADARSEVYEERFRMFAPASLSYSEGVYTAEGPGGKVSFANPDFSFNEFRSNLVARWEYLPGSTLYFVWERHLSGRSNQYIRGWRPNLDRMSALPATNTFMIKLNYWFTL